MGAGFLSGAITITARSLISKFVSPVELGRIFSVLAALQAMIPLAANPVYGWLYRATVAWQPGTFLLFNAVLSSAIFLLLLTVNIGLVRQASKAATNTDPLLAP